MGQSETTVFGDVLDDARGAQAEAVALRRRIHRAPELGLENPRTQEAILESLDGLGLLVATGDTSTSVVATLEGGRGPGRTILLRGDTDGLPLVEQTSLDYRSVVDGAMHACGHDAHVAMLAGAARLLAERRDEFAGRVVFMFQPGEEGAGGAPAMIEDGLLDTAGGRPTAVGPVDAAFAIHTTPTAPAGMIVSRAGPLLASADVFEVVITGQGGHASQPHDAVDPIPVACEIVQALNVAMTRRVDIFDPGLLTVGQITAGTADNVIPETATIVGTIRAVSERTRRRIHGAVRQVAEGIASAHECSAAVELRDGYPVTVNDGDAARFALGVAAQLVGPESTVELPNPVMGSEDFSYVLQRVPGAMVFLGTRPTGGSGRVAPNHSNRMVLNEEAMSTGIAFHVAVALQALAGGIAAHPIPT